MGERSENRWDLTEADMLAMLRKRHAKSGNGGSGEWAFLTHVRNHAGHAGTEAGKSSRVFDAVALHLYRSSGLAMHIFEVKVSRSDWLRELADPTKAKAATDVADYFWIAAPAGIVKRDELRPGWGLIEATGRMRMRRTVEAQRLTGGVPGPIDRGLLVGLLRSAPGAVPGKSRWCSDTHRMVPVWADLFPELHPDAQLRCILEAQGDHGTEASR